MKICFGFSQIYVFRCSYDAYGDVSATCIKKKGIEKLAIMYKEVDVKPKRICQYNFSKFRNTVVATRSYSAFIWFFYYYVASHQVTQKLQVALMSALLTLLFKSKLLLQHQTHELIFFITYDYHVDLLGYNLILHYNYIMNNSSSSEEVSHRNSTIRDILYISSSNILIGSKKAKTQKTYIFDFYNSFEVITGHSLLKKTLNTSWSERYFLLTPTRLLYFNDSNMKVLKGCFNLASLIQHKLTIKPSFPIISLVVRVDHQQQSHKTLLQLKIQEADLFKQWENELSRVIYQLQLIRIEDRMLFPIVKNQHLLENNSKLGISNGNFWNNIHISIHQLFKYCGHLDIILLRSKNPLFYFHRFFMRSYFDHVAILFKDEKEKVLIFEAIQSKGVCISSLESLLATFGEEYEQIGYRKLLLKNNANFHLEQLEEYINRILGSRYELSLSKLLLDNQTIQNDQGLQTDEEQPYAEVPHEKTYFCSQLVADIYLKFGILTQGKSNNYWPKDFQQDQMIFSQEFSFSPLMKVQLQDPPETSEQSEV